jgi:hypothetical protein
VTNYSKKYQVSYLQNKKNFDVYMEYKAQLTDYGKRYFDPFNRSGNLIKLVYDTDTNEVIYTTFKQLNFLKWALKNKVIKYVENNIDEINKDYQNSRKNKKEVPKIKKVKEITVLANKDVIFKVGKQIFKFGK